MQLFPVAAWFNDTETSSDNSFQMGTWAIDAGDGGDDATITFYSLTPGDSGIATWPVTNTGTIPGFLDITIGVSESGAGSLGEFLLIHIYTVGYVGSIYGSSVSPEPVIDAGGGYDLNLMLEPGDSLDIALDWMVNGAYIPDAADEVIFIINFDIQPVP